MTIKEVEIQLALGSLSYNDKVKLTKNLYTSKKILTKLSTDKDWIVRWGVARNLNTPVETLAKLSEDEDANVRHTVARNHNTPIKVLTRLSKDEDYSVRYWAGETLEEKRK